MKRKQRILIGAVILAVCVVVMGSICLPALVSAGSTSPNDSIGVESTTGQKPTRRTTVATSADKQGTTSTKQAKPTVADVQALVETYLDYKARYDASLDDFLIYLGLTTQSELDVYHSAPHNFPMGVTYRAYTNVLWRVIDVDAMGHEFITDSEHNEDMMTPHRADTPLVTRTADTPVFVEETKDEWIYRVQVSTAGERAQVYRCVIREHYGMFHIHAFEAE